MAGSFPETHAEWSYARDELGIVYCLGRDTGDGTHEMVGAYYRTEQEYASKRSLAEDEYFRRLVYQGLPEERERLAQVERPEVVNRLLSHTATTGTGIFMPAAALSPSEPKYRSTSTWLEMTHPNARAFQSALAIAVTALQEVGVSRDSLSLYGGASFGVVNASDKVVDDVDFVLRPDSIGELRGAIQELQTPYSWDEIDPFGRLPKERQFLKAKRWSTSQIRLAQPYFLSIDLKVARMQNAPSLWDTVAETTDQERFVGDLQVVNDDEALCTSPALLCEDISGNRRILRMEGYQYIGCAVVGDVINVTGNAYRDSEIVTVTQSSHDGIMPDFRNVPIS